MSSSRPIRVFVTHHLPAIVWAALLAVLLLTPADDLTLPPIGWLIGRSSFWMDIVGHLVCFSVMGWLAALSMRALGVLRATVAAIAVSTIYGAFLELGQIPAPGRAFQVLDLVTNGIGAAMGAWLYVYVIHVILGERSESRDPATESP